VFGPDEDAKVNCALEMERWDTWGKILRINVEVRVVGLDFDTGNFMSMRMGERFGFVRSER